MTNTPNDTGKTYNRQIPGPDLKQPFQVVSGFVVVELCVPGSLLLPAGAGWPGLERLPKELLDYLKSGDTIQGPGTEVRPGLDEAGIAQALLLIHTQVLCSIGLVSDRIFIAERLGYRLREMTGETAAGLLGATRERVSKLLNATK